MIDRKTVAFIGLGVMGYPMAGFLAKAGHKVKVFNRTQTRADQWVEHFKGQASATPKQAAEGADIVFCCVGNDDDLRAVTLNDDGAFSGMKPGALFVDHTTTSATVAKALSAIAKEKHISFVDAPVSGGQAGAEKGVLTIMCGGTQADYDKAEPVMQSYASRTRLMGEVGSGQLTKMVNQICIAGVVQGLSEGLHFAHQAGLDGAAVVEVISKGAAQSWQMENRYQSMMENHYDHGFAVDWMRKDLGFCLQEADNNGASLPLTALVDQFYKDVQALGGGRWDTSSLLRRLESFQPTPKD